LQDPQSTFFPLGSMTNTRIHTEHIKLQFHITHLYTTDQLPLLLCKPNMDITSINCSKIPYCYVTLVCTA
jgi:hypothetical protein